MKKILFSFVALTIAVAANAFSLTLHKGATETAPIVITTDNPDVFGDGTVAVRVDEDKDIVHIVLTDADLYSKDDYPTFNYVGDATYQDVILHINGLCVIGSNKERSIVPFMVSNAVMQIVPNAPGAVFEIFGSESLVVLSGDASLYVGNTIDNVCDKPLKVYFTKNDTYDAVFRGVSSGTQEVYFLFADVEIECKGGMTSFAEDLETKKMNNTQQKYQHYD